VAVTRKGGNSEIIQATNPHIDEMMSVNLPF